MDSHRNAKIYQRENIEITIPSNSKYLNQNPKRCTNRKIALLTHFHDCTLLYNSLEHHPHPIYTVQLPSAETPRQCYIIFWSFKGTVA